MINFEDKELRTFVSHILNSYQHFYGEKLLTPENNDFLVQIYNAPFVLISHNSAPDPMFKFGNKMGLDLWEKTWEEFTSTLSKYTAENHLQYDRKIMLDEIAKTGFTNKYSGVRISSSGKKFFVENMKIWNVLNEKKEKIGQAAYFSEWKFL